MQDLWDPLPCDLPIMDGVIKRALVAREVLIDKLFVVLPAFRMQLVIVRCPDHDSGLIACFFLLTKMRVSLREPLIILPLNDDLTTLLIGCAIAEIATEEHAY